MAHCRKNKGYNSIHRCADKCFPFGMTFILVALLFLVDRYQPILANVLGTGDKKTEKQHHDNGDPFPD